jgi:Fur family ferric uptake transcriptional regulator
MLSCPQSEFKIIYEGALRRIKKAQLKLTGPRKALVHAIAHYQGPFAAEDIFNAVKKSAKNKKFDLVTVYRTLTTFEDLGILTSCHFGDGTIRYEVRGEDGHHHHHIICTSCKKIRPLPFCHLDDEEKRVQKMGFLNLTHKLEFFGLCPDCQ